MNKIVLWGAGLVMAAGAVYVGATGAFFTSSASATGNTFTAGTLTLQLTPDLNGVNGGPNVNTWGSTLASTWNFANMAPGGTPQVQTIWLRNNGTIDAAHLGISAVDNNINVANFDKQVRITTLTLGGSNLLTGGAGATIGAYVAPTNCDVTVSGTKLSAAVADTANSGKVVCVAPGSYTSAWEGSISQITVNQPMTIVSTQGPSVTSVIPFNVMASNVTIRGFSISDPNGRYGVQISGGASTVAVEDNNIHDIGTTLPTGSAQGISLQNGSSGGSTFTFSGNTITNIGNLSLAWDGVSGSGTSAKGIYIGDTSSTAAAVSGVTISNNVISHVQASTVPWVGHSGAWTSQTGRGSYGVMTNVKGGVTNLVVKNNSISGLEGLWSHAVGLEGNTPNASVTLNDIHDLIDHKGNTDAVGIRIEDPNTSSASIVINQNNLTPNVAIGISNAATGAATVNGQNNWWGDQNPSDQVSGPVTTAGFLGGPIAGLINGVDQNSNGYADLNDLTVAPGLSGATGLAHGGVSEPLVIGVQLDGPSTTDAFQGGTMTSALTFTLSQQ